MATDETASQRSSRLARETAETEAEEERLRKADQAAFLDFVRPREITVAEAARLTGREPKLIRYYLTSGKIPGRKVPGTTNGRPEWRLLDRSLYDILKKPKLVGPGRRPYKRGTT